VGVGGRCIGKEANIAEMEMRERKDGFMKGAKADGDKRQERL
jgi:hypothetical protein